MSAIGVGFGPYLNSWDLDDLLLIRRKARRYGKNKSKRIGKLLRWHQTRIDRGLPVPNLDRDLL